ncbi:MAG: ROK family protein [Thermoanaerobaculia bacterium]
MVPENCVGVDLGGTKILAGVVSSRGRVLARAKVKTPFASGSKALGEAIVATVSEALSGAGPGRLRAIGIGSPGPIDPDRGVVLRTPNIAVRNFRIRDLLARRFDVPVVLDNDVDMALWGEFRAGAGRGHRNLVGLWVGTGIGGALIIDGRLLHGINKNAGEIGHMVLEASGAKPGGPEGTLEWEASKTGIARFLREGVRKGEKTSLDRLRRRDRLHSSALGKAYRSGDRLTRLAVAHSARHVGIAIANLFNVFAPEIFVLGGGVVEDLGEPYLRAVRDTAKKFAFTTELAGIRIESARLGADSGVVGAALAARALLSA